jgi:hypothetical protein
MEQLRAESNMVNRLKMIYFWVRFEDLSEHNYLELLEYAHTCGRHEKHEVQRIEESSGSYN